MYCMTGLRSCTGEPAQVYVRGQGGREGEQSAIGDWKSYKRREGGEKRRERRREVPKDPIQPN